MSTPLPEGPGGPSLADLLGQLGGAAPDAGPPDAGPPPGGPIGAGGPPPGVPASIMVNPDQGGPPGQGPGGPDQQGRGREARPLSILSQMIDLAQQYIQVEPDDVDKHTMMKVLSTLQQYKAKDQQDTEKALGSGPAVRSLARATRGGGY